MAHGIAGGSVPDPDTRCPVSCLTVNVSMQNATCLCRLKGPFQSSTSSRLDNHTCLFIEEFGR